MRTERVISVLRGEPSGPLPGVSWLPSDIVTTYLGLGEREPLPSHVAQVASGVGAAFAFVPASGPAAADIAAELHAADIAVGWSIDGPLGRLAERDGWPATLRAAAAEPRVFSKRLEDTWPEMVAEARDGFDSGADFVVLADDLVAERGWLVPEPAILAGWIPAASRLAASCAKAGMPLVFHSDGDAGTLFGHLACLGFAGVHLAPSNDAEESRLRDAAARAGLVTLGGIRAAALERMSAEQVALVVASGAATTLVCDDGGITLPNDLAKLEAAFLAWAGSL